MSFDITNMDAECNQPTSSYDRPIKGREYPPREEAKLRDKIQDWLDQVKTFSNQYDYDPHAYSIDEWESYLRKKNFNVTFKTFLTSNSWRIPVKKYDMRVLREKFEESRKNAITFLSDSEINYVYRLFDYIAELEQEVKESKINCLEAFQMYGDQSDILKQARDTARVIYNNWRFACKWKYIPNDTPEELRVQIAALIKRELIWKRRSWEAYQQCLNTGAIYDQTKVRLFNNAVANSVFTEDEVAHLWDDYNAHTSPDSYINNRYKCRPSYFESFNQPTSMSPNNPMDIPNKRLGSQQSEEDELDRRLKALEAEKAEMLRTIEKLSQKYNALLKERQAGNKAKLN